MVFNMVTDLPQHSVGFVNFPADSSLYTNLPHI